MAESVVLQFPRDARYYSVARLVVGGMAAPLDMSYDALDDLQLAISSLLDHAVLVADEQLTIRLEVDEVQLTTSIGCFQSESVSAAFGTPDPEASELGLRRLLDTIVDEVAIETTADGDWVTLTKRMRMPA